MDALAAPFSLGNARLVLLGLGSGALVAGVAVRRGREQLGWLTVAVALVVAVAATDRWDDIRPIEAIDGLGLAAACWAAVGARELHRAGRFDRWGVPAAVVATLAGVWAAVPENRQVVTVAGVVAGLVLVGVLLERPLAPSGVAALAAAVPWTVAAGVTYTEVSYVGALLCLGSLLWWPVLGASRSGPQSWRELTLVAGVHVASVLAASRWIGSAADATWTRVGVVVAAGGVAAVMLRLAGPGRRPAAAGPSTPAT